MNPFLLVQSILLLSASFQEWFFFSTVFGIAATVFLVSMGISCRLCMVHHCSHVLILFLPFLPPHKFPSMLVPLFQILLLVVLLLQLLDNIPKVSLFLCLSAFHADTSLLLPYYNADALFFLHPTVFLFSYFDS